MAFQNFHFPPHEYHFTKYVPTISIEQTYLYQASNSFEMEWDTKHALHLHTHTENRALVFHMGIRHSDIICLHGNAPEVKETEKF